MLPNKHTSKIALYFITLTVLIFALVFYISALGYSVSEMPQIRTREQPRANNEESICDLDVVNCSKLRYVTAYTPSPDETDDTPCISASGLNICEALKENRNIVATNELPLGSKVKIADVIYEVQDRTNSRYQYRYDILMATKTEAYNWGVKILNVEFL